MEERFLVAKKLVTSNIAKLVAESVQLSSLYEFFMSIIIKTEEAFDKTVSYVRICGSGMLVIIAYNLIGCIFRGLGDSRTPLATVAIACVCNIAGDLLLCAVCCVQNGNERRSDCDGICTGCECRALLWNDPKKRASV